jgi:hypothetical protein
MEGLGQLKNAVTSSGFETDTFWLVPLWRLALNLYISFASMSEVSQSHQTLKYDHESLGTRNQESLRWRGPAVIQ